MGYILALTELEQRILRALRSGPLYRPTLELVVGAGGSHVRDAIARLEAGGLVRLAREIGPATWELTDDGRDALEG